MGMLDGLTNMFKMHDDDDLMTITKIMMMISVMTMMMRNHQQERIFLERIPRKIQ